MDRRDAFHTAGAAAVAAFSAPLLAQAQTGGGHNHAGHDHSAHHHHDAAAAGLAAAASDCVLTSQACIAHCIELLADGDRAMAACARSVSQQMAICSALQALAQQNAPYLRAMAAVARQACLDCEKECRKHESKHSVCRDCAEACAICAKECQAFAA